MKKMLMCAGIFFAIAFLLMISGPSRGDLEQTGNAQPPQRIAGKNRYETSRLIAEEYTARQANKEGYARGQAAVIVSGQDLAGALAAAPLAARLNAPILLYENAASSSALQECEIFLKEHLHPEGTLYLIGGEDLISGDFDDKYTDYQVKRIVGGSVLENNLLLARELNAPEGTPVFVVNEGNYPDAISCAGIAAMKGYPLLYIATDSSKDSTGHNSIGGNYMDSETLAFLTDLKPESVYIIGSENSVPLAVEEQLKNLVSDVQIKRIRGRDRFETATKVIREFIQEPRELFFASGLDFTDALSGTVLAAQADSPLILLNTEKIEPALAVDLYLNHLCTQKIAPPITVLGGNRVVSNTLAENLQKILYSGYETEQLKSYRVLRDQYISDFRRDINDLEKRANRDNGYFEDICFDEMDLSQVAPPKPNEITSLVISAAGDCTLGIDPRYAYQGSLPQVYDERGPDHFLSGVKDIFGQDDLTIVNLEGALTKSTERADKSYQLIPFWFSGDPAYTEILTRGSVEAVNLANNHAKDFTEKGYRDTLEALQEAGITYFGNGDQAVVEIKGVKIGLLGFNLTGLNPYPSVEEIKANVLKKISSVRDRCEVLIVSFHWGRENNYGVTDLQKQLAHFTIDNGADLILGHHPHVLEPIEKYQDKYIVYSLGNFVFGGNYNPWDKDTAIFQQSLKLVNGEFRGLGEANVIPCKLSSVDYQNDYQPVPAEKEAEKTRIFKKLQWDKSVGQGIVPRSLSAF